MVAGNGQSAKDTQAPAKGPMDVLWSALDAYRAASAEPGADLDHLKVDLVIVALQTQAHRLAETAEILQGVAKLLDR